VIRAAIGRLVLHCMDQAKKRQFRGEWTQLDPAKMTDQQISNVIHGRPIDSPGEFHQPGVGSIRQLDNVT
jgi:hypothetical protein